MNPAERNEQLEQELRDMKQLMYVVAPQHYIDDEALQFDSNSVQYTRPVEIQYECYTSGNGDFHDITSQVGGYFLGLLSPWQDLGGKSGVLRFEQISLTWISVGEEVINRKFPISITSSRY